MFWNTVSKYIQKQDGKQVFSVTMLKDMERILGSSEASLTMVTSRAMQLLNYLRYLNL